MNIPDEHVDFDNVVVRDESDEAIKVELDDGRIVWIPKSLVHDDSEAYELGTDGTLYIPEWFALNKDLL